jgi:myo-inositol-1(or 4)-monophosphatase
VNSADAYVLKESLRLVESKVHRDFRELENLQNTRGSVDFTNLTVDYLNGRLYDFFLEKRPKYSVTVKGYGKGGSKNPDGDIYVNSLCGVSNLLHGIPYFATAISLKKNGVAALAAVNNYASNELFLAAQGKGAFINDRRIRVSNRTATDNVLIAIKQDQSGKLFDKVISQFRNFEVNNCYVLDFCYTACGRYDASVVFGGGEEELKLGSLFIVEAGGLCHRMDSGADGTIFSNPLLMDDIKGIIV